MKEARGGQTNQHQHSLTGAKTRERHHKRGVNDFSDSAQSDLERARLSRARSNLRFKYSRTERKIFRIIVWKLEEVGASPQVTEGFVSGLWPVWRALVRSPTPGVINGPAVLKCFFDVIIWDV